jgi:hypothetical protein
MKDGKEMIEKREMKNKKTLPIIGAVGAGIAIIALLITVVVLATKPEPAIVTPETGGRGTVVTPENIDEIREEIEEPVQDGYYRTRMNVDWDFPTSQTPSRNAYVENAPQNTRTVYFDVILEDTNESVYSSPFIPVGAKLEGFALDAELPKGDYAAIVVYHLVDDEHQEITTLSVSVNLHVMG